VAFQLQGNPQRGKTMDRKAEEATEGQRKTVVILSDRSREIIRLFEERQHKRQQAEQDSRPHPFSRLPDKS
jgi:hypothetical protein